MQTLIETIKYVAGKPWFPIFGFALAIAVFYGWEAFSQKEIFIRWWVKLQPNNPEAHLALGSLLAEDDEYYDEAEREFRRGIELNPKVRQGYHRLFALQIETKKEIQAEETANQLIELFPDDPIAYSGEAWLAEKNGDFQKAEEYYHKAISLTPRALFILEFYGNFLTDQNRLLEAEDIQNKCLKLDSTSYRTNLLGLTLLEKQGKLSEAEKSARKFAKLFPNDSLARAWLGHVLHSKGKSEEALKIFNQIIEKDPKYIWPYIQVGAGNMAARRFMVGGRLCTL